MTPGEAQFFVRRRGGKLLRLVVDGDYCGDDAGILAHQCEHETWHGIQNDFILSVRGVLQIGSGWGDGTYPFRCNAGSSWGRGRMFHVVCVAEEIVLPLSEELANYASRRMAMISRLFGFHPNYKA